MTIHAIDKNMKISSIIIDYRDRPDGSESVNTYSDGFKVLRTQIGCISIIDHWHIMQGISAYQC